MRLVALLAMVFVSGVLLSCAATAVMYVILRTFRLLPQSDLERTVVALMKLLYERDEPVLSRLLASVGATVLPVSVSAALAVLSLVPSAEVSGAIASLRTQSKIEPERVEMAVAAGPPDVWAAFDQVERDASIAARYRVDQPVLCEALVMNGADKFRTLLDKADMAWSAEINDAVLHMPGYAGSIDRTAVEVIYGKLSAICADLRLTGRTVSVDHLLADVRSRLDSMRVA